MEYPISAVYKEVSYYIYSALRICDDCEPVKVESED